MKVLHIIGNGLDISLGMETQYKAFLQNYYLTKDNPKETILKLKKNINQNLDNWSDAELEFGKYAKCCETAIEYIECIKDFKSNLREYIQLQYQSILNSHTAYDFTDFLSDLHYPGNKLASVVQRRFNKYINPLSGTSEDMLVRIITFNYTNTFEEMLRKCVKLNEGLFNVINSIKVYHVHGTLDNQMTFGVNDPSQIISEKNILDDSNYFEIVKPLFNDACLNTNNNDCEDLINTADVISIYGVSVGATDQKWWDLVGENMQKRTDLVVLYFPFDDTKDTVNEPQYLRDWCNNYTNDLMQRLKLPFSDEEIRDRIFVNVNASLFNVITPKVD